MQKSRKAVSKSRDEYEECLAKFMATTVKEGKEGKSQKYEDELAGAKRRFELARFDQVGRGLFCSVARVCLIAQHQSGSTSVKAQCRLIPLVSMLSGKVFAV